jgi:hypothetical protein
MGLREIVMATAKDYAQQVDRIAKSLPKKVEGAAHAKAVIAQIRMAQKELRQVKSTINLEIKAIRNAYKQQKPGSTGAGILRIFGKRKLAGQLSADAKRQASAERDKQIAPYERVKLLIDDVLAQLDGHKIRLDQLIIEEKQAAASGKK